MSQQDQPDFSIPTLGPTGRDSRRSWHSELSWDGDAPLWAPVNLLEVRSKMFPRGCRGFIHRIRIYCRDSAAAGGTISVFISPAPYIGQLYSGVIAVPVGGVAAWRDWNVRQMWNYDSLFIWFYTSNANTEVAYDYNGPDCLHSSDGGVTWFEHPVDRFYVRVEFQVETAGDVPVSGTINNIPIPNVSSPRVFQVFNLNNNLETDVVNLYGAGEVEYIWAGVFAAVLSESTIIRVYCDGLVSWADVVGGFGAVGFTASTPKISQIRAAVNGACDLLLSVKFCFRRHLRITAQRAVGAGAITGFIAGVINLVR